MTNTSLNTHARSAFSSPVTTADAAYQPLLSLSRNPHTKNIAPCLVFALRHPSNQERLANIFTSPPFTTEGAEKVFISPNYPGARPTQERIQALRDLSRNSAQQNPYATTPAQYADLLDALGSVDTRHATPHPCISSRYPSTEFLSAEKYTAFFAHCLRHLAENEYPIPIGFQPPQQCVQHAMRYLLTDEPNHPLQSAVDQLDLHTTQPFLDPLIDTNRARAINIMMLKTELETQTQAGKPLLVAGSGDFFGGSGRSYAAHACIFLGVTEHQDQSYAVLFDGHDESVRVWLQPFLTEQQATSVHHLSPETLRQEGLLPLLFRFMPLATFHRMLTQEINDPHFLSTGLYQLQDEAKQTSKCVIQ